MTNYRFAQGFIAGSLVCSAIVAAATGDQTYQKLRVFAQVLSYVQQSYVDEVQVDSLIYDGISGMLAHLDPYTTFLRPAEYEKLREDTAGEFGGLGVEVALDGPALSLRVVHTDSPAAHAGLKAGDRVLAVDGELLGEHALETSVRLMRGLPGSRVVLRVSRSGWDKPRDVLLIRKQVHVPSVQSERLPDGIAYIRLRAFQERTDQELGHALVALDPIRGLVLDLRDNPGGLLDEGVKVADRFLSSGIIVTTQGRQPQNNGRELAHPDGTEPNYPIVVLVNEGTASASEIVAGALKDHHRARLVGTKTYGKGSVQTLFGLDDGGGLKLTIARYFTPSGQSIHGKGIVPDVVVALPAGPALVPGDSRADPQLAAAVLALRSKPATHQ